MAKAQAKKTEDTTPITMPAGFTPVSPDSGNRAYVIKEAGMTILGRLLGRYARKKLGRDGKRQYFYQVKIDELTPNKAIRYDGEGKARASKEVSLERGEILTVDESSAIADLQPYADSDGVFDVYIRYEEKASLDGGMSYWRMQSATKQIKPPSKPIGEYVAHAEDMDDVPF